MSNSNGIALIVATFASLMFLYMFVTKVTNDLGGQIATGVIGSVPISTKTRSIMLYQMWGSHVAGLVIFGVMLAIASLEIAGNVSDVGVRRLAYLSAVIGAYASLHWLLNGILTFRHYRSVVSEGSRAG